MNDQPILDLTFEQKRALFAPVAPHADTIHGLPILTHVHLYGIDGHLVAEATDQYTLGIQRIPYEGVSKGDIDVLVPADMVKAMLKTRVMWNRIGFDPMPIRPAELADKASDMKYPNVKPIIPDLTLPIDGRVSRSSFRPDFLKRFASVGGVVTIHMGKPMMPVIVTSDDGTFVGAIIPTRDDEYVTPDVSWARGEA